MFLTDFKIGYAPSNVLELYYSAKVSWWSEVDIILTVSLSSFAFTYYPNEKTESGLFWTGGLGLASFDAPFENVNPSYGFGLYGGIGYEFSKHLNVEGDLIYSRITDVGVVLDTYTVRFTINALAY